MHFDLPVASAAGEPSAYALCWLLYVVAKARLLPPFPDLVSSFNLLICVIALVYAHVPPRLRLGAGLAAATPAAAPPGVGGRDAGAAPGGSGGANPLARLAASNKVEIYQATSIQLHGIPIVAQLSQSNNGIAEKHIQRALRIPTPDWLQLGLWLWYGAHTASC